jgi:hypothetical protein
VASGHYAIIPISLADGGSHVWLEDAYGLRTYTDTSVTYPSSSNDGQAWSYNTVRHQWQWTKYPTPDDAANKFGLTEKLNACEQLRISEIGANYSPQFIELYNNAGRTIDISGCQIQTNQSSGTSYVFPEGTKLARQQYVSVAIQKTELQLTKTTSGTVYVLSSDGADEVDAKAYADLDANTSFALIGGTWKQTFAVTPGSENVYQEYPACEDGYVRNDETGRCNKAVAAASTLKPCAANQYRSAETNRCRNITSATSTLTTCKAGYYRNPTTNRCRKIASTVSTLVPCKEGYERNTVTNRCRKVASTLATTPVAEFPVEEIKDTGSAFIAWWALGGIVLVGVAYATWEWRSELSQMLHIASRQK